MNEIEQIRSELTFYGDDEDLERSVVETLSRLPDEVRDFALADCMFVSIGRGAMGRADLLYFPAGRTVWLITLCEITLGDMHSDDVLSIVAHEVAHAWLRHGEPDKRPAADEEAQASKLAMSWGFSGVGCRQH